MELIYGAVLIMGSGLALMAALRMSRSGMGTGSSVAPEPMEQSASVVTPVVPASTEILPAPLDPSELIDLLRREALRQMDALLGSTLRDLREFENEERRRHAKDARGVEVALIIELEGKIDRDLDAMGFWSKVGFDRDEYLRSLFQQVIETHDDCLKRCLDHLRDGLREFLVEHVEPSDEAGPVGPVGLKRPGGWYDAFANGLVLGAGAALFPVGYFAAAGFVAGFIARGFVDMEELKRKLKEESSRTAHQLLTGDGIVDEKSKERFESVVVKMSAATKRVCDEVKARFEAYAAEQRARAVRSFDELAKLARSGKLAPSALEDPEWVYEHVWEGGSS